jgi:homoserine acetyltransferase
MIIDKNKIKTVDFKKPLQLESGQILDSFTVAYETFGTLNKNKDNAILVFHALSGDQFATGINPITNKEGWWVTAIGPNKAVDTNKYFIICANVLGGCMGTSGPTSINSKTNELFVFSVVQWVECKYCSFVRAIQIELTLQFQLLVPQVILLRILHLMNWRVRPLWQILTGVMEST